MGIFSAFLNPWSFLLVALAIIHFIRRRPDTYWLYIILFLGPSGSRDLPAGGGSSRCGTFTPVLQNVS